MSARNLIQEFAARLQSLSAETDFEDASYIRDDQEARLLAEFQAMENLVLREELIALVALLRETATLPISRQ